MYTADLRDRVVELHDVPQCSPGAPCPIVLASGSKAVVVYHRRTTSPGWDGTTARMVGPDGAGEPAAIVEFHRVTASPGSGASSG